MGEEGEHGRPQEDSAQLIIVARSGQSRSGQKVLVTRSSFCGTMLDRVAPFAQ